MWRERVRYATPLGSVASVVREFDVFVLSSRSEGVPTSLLEAMSCGLPSIAFDVGGVREVLRHEADGLLVGGPDATRLADGLRRLLSDPELRHLLGRSARQRAVQEFASEQCAHVHRLALEAAVRSRPVRRAQ